MMNLPKEGGNWNEDDKEGRHVQWNAMGTYVYLWKWIWPEILGVREELGFYSP